MAKDDSGASKWFKTSLDVTSSVAMIVVSGVLVWAVMAGRASRSDAPPKPVALVSPSKQLPAQAMSLERGPWRGATSAKVAVVEYSDFECPFCAKFENGTYRTVVKPYVEAGRVRFVFRHFPLERRHPAAFRAAEAAECSDRQGRFWEMHDVLFAPGQRLDVPGLFAKVKKIGISSDRFAECMKGQASARIRQDIAEARAFGITATPSFLFGVVDPDGRRLKVVRRESGAVPAEAFVAILEQLLKVAASGAG